METPAKLANEVLLNITGQWIDECPDFDIKTIFSKALDKATLDKAAGKKSGIRGARFVSIFEEEISNQCSSISLSFLQAIALELSILAIEQCMDAINSESQCVDKAWRYAIKAVSLSNEAKGMLVALKCNKGILEDTARVKREINQGTLKTKMEGLKYFAEILLSSKNKSAAVADVADKFDISDKTVYAWLKWKEEL